MDQQQALFNYCLQRADDSLILGQRLGELCGHGPALEEDMAMTNTALDLIGEARELYQYAAEIEGKGRSEDDLAYLRNDRDFKNIKLMELPRGDYAHTITRNFLFHTFHLELQSALMKCNDERLSGLAGKVVKEATYHVRHASDWMIRFGDGTDESHKRTQQAIEDLWPFTGEMFETSEAEKVLVDAGLVPDPASLKAAWDKRVNAVLQEATLKRPADEFMHSGGRKGNHTEHLGFILAEMQHLHRTHPGVTW